MDEKSQSFNQANDQIHCLSWVFFFVRFDGMLLDP